MSAATPSVAPLLRGLLAASLALPTAAQSEALFRASHFPVGGEPKHVDAGDVDGDGLPDLVLSTELDARALLADGAGGFLPAVTSAGGATAQVLLDLDGDGLPDLCQARRNQFLMSPPGIRVRLGAGDGSFAEGTQYLVDGEPSELVAADVNEDGAPDLASISSPWTGEQSPRGALLLGHRDGTFDQVVYFAPITPSGSFLDAGDLDGDGCADMVVASASDNTTRAFLSLGDGTFAPAVLTGGGLPQRLALGDCDGDGTLDLAIDRVPNAIGIRHGAGDGTFGPAVSQFYNGEWAVTDVDTADVDEDGLADVLFAVGTPVGFATSSSALGVLLGEAQLALQPPRLHGSNRNLQGVAAADLNGDGDLDLATADAGPDTATVLLGEGDGRFLPVLHTGSNTNVVRVGDLDEDGWPDLLASNRGQPDLARLLGGGNGRFEPVQFSPLGSYSGGMELADADGDGHLDALVAASGLAATAAFRVLLGDGDGGLSAPVVTNGGFDLAGLAVGDLDHDGALDVASFDQLDFTLHVALGDGDGSFTTMPPVTLGFPGGFEETLAVADVTENGDLDLVSSDVGFFPFGTGQILVAPGAGDGTFLAPLATSPGLYVTSLSLADVDGDDHLDLLEASSFFGGSAVRLGDGDGGFSDELPLATTLEPESPVAADIDGDGLLDVLLGTGLLDVGHVLFFAGHGDGTFEPPQTFITAVTSDSIVPADLDLDGHLDLAVACALANVVEVLHNEHGPWGSVGTPLAGTLGLPRMLGAGPLTGNSPVSFELRDALPSAATALVLGPTRIDAPFKGGVMVPVPAIIGYPLAMDAEGGLLLEATWPAGLGSGEDWYFQYWTPDPAGVKGFSASNGLVGLTP